MKLIYNRTDFPSGRSHILMRDADSPSPELVHFVLVLSNKGTMWVDVFWPYDEGSERLTRRISEQQYWQTFREWRLHGVKLGNSEQVAENLARRQLSLKSQKIAEF